MSFQTSGGRINAGLASLRIEHDQSRGMVHRVVAVARSGTFMKTSPNDLGEIGQRRRVAAGRQRVGLEEVRRTRRCLAGVSRSGSTETNSTRGRIETGIASQDFCALASSASVVGQTSGQWVKPRKTMVQAPRREAGVASLPSENVRR